MTPEAVPAASLRLRDVSLWYGRFQALRHVSLDVRGDAITALIGPSGCGKSTLLRCFNRLNERYGTVTTAGRVEVLGRDVHDADVSLGELRRRVGMVFQRPNPLPASVEDNVLFGLSVHGGCRAQPRAHRDELVESALRDVLLWDDLKDRLAEPATLLTLEQQQKLCIARLLPLRPDVILMDEPCSALDAEGTAAIEELARRLAAGRCIVIVTHNLAQARRLSDECAVMMLGELVESGPTDRLFLHPRRPETEAYVEGRYG